MQEREFYEQILGLESPFVSSVKLDMQGQQVDVYVEHSEGIKFCCPECSQLLSCYDHASTRTWRHLDTMQFETLLHAAVPRVSCLEHGVKQAKVPWAEPRSRFSLLFERLAIDVLLSTQGIKSAQAILRTGWEQTWSILVRAVRRGQLRKTPLAIRHLGIDEKSFSKWHIYLTLRYRLERSWVEAGSDGYDTTAANACFSKLSPSQIESVEAIALDMNAAYVRSAKENIPLAEEKIVHDRFHVMKLAADAVDRVLRQENRKLKKDDDPRLTGAKFPWIKSQENLTDKQRVIFDEVFSCQLATAEAWA